MNTAILAALYLCQPSVAPRVSMRLSPLQRDVDLKMVIRDDGMVAVRAAPGVEAIIVLPDSDMVRVLSSGAKMFVFVRPPPLYVAQVLDYGRVPWAVLGDDFFAFSHDLNTEATTFTTL